MSLLPLQALRPSLPPSPVRSSPEQSSGGILTFAVSYDTGYDDRSRSLNVVACSDGSNGLITRYGWQTQGSIPRFPYIGGYEGVAGWNSPQARTQLSTPLRSGILTFS